MTDKCQRCDGCGRIASGEEGAPWTMWESLPPGSKAAVELGFVKPIPCPECGGFGTVNSDYPEEVRAAMKRMTDWQDAGCPDDRHQLSGAITTLLERVDNAHQALQVAESNELKIAAEMDEIRADLRALITELRKKPWHLDPDKVADRLEAAVEEGGER